MDDIRLYYYVSGQLLKPQAKDHRFKSSVQAFEHVRQMRKRRYGGDKWKNTQFVIIEYSGPYKSRIIDIIDEQQ